MVNGHLNLLERTQLGRTNEPSSGGPVASCDVDGSAPFETPFVQMPFILPEMSSGERPSGAGADSPRRAVLTDFGVCLCRATKKSGVTMICYTRDTL